MQRNSLRPMRLTYAATILAVLTCGSVMNASLDAAPVTIHFDALVASAIPTRGGADLPFNVTVGDVIQGSFTFDPATGGPLYPQPYPLSFTFTDQTISTNDFQIRVRNDAGPERVPLTGSLADPANTLIVDQESGISDTILVSCTPESGSLCGFIPSHPEIVFQSHLSFVNEIELLTSEDLIAAPSIWNGFSFKEMSIAFLNTNTNGSTRIGAYLSVTSATQVPEPSTGILLGLLGGLITIFLRNRSPLTPHLRHLTPDT